MKPKQKKTPKSKDRFTWYGRRGNIAPADTPKEHAFYRSAARKRRAEQKLHDELRQQPDDE